MTVLVMSSRFAPWCANTLLEPSRRLAATAIVINSVLFRFCTASSSKVWALSYGCRSGELRRVNPDVRLHVAQLERGPPVQPGHRPAKRHLDSRDLPVVGVVNLGDKAADRR